MRRIAALFTAVTCASIGACGGGDPSAIASDAQGIWRGTTTSDRIFTAIVLSDGSYYAMYSEAHVHANYLAGFVAGTGATAGTSFNSSNGVDFNGLADTVTATTLTASFVPRTRFDGIFVGAGGSIDSFAASYDPDYEREATIPALTGAYIGVAATTPPTSGAAASLNISPTGVVTGSFAGCNFTGQTSPRSQGNVYDISATFGAPSCLMPSQTMRGIAYYRASARELTAILVAPGRNEALGFVGIKP